MSTLLLENSYHQGFINYYIKLLRYVQIQIVLFESSECLECNEQQFYVLFLDNNTLARGRRVGYVLRTMRKLTCLFVELLLPTGCKLSLRMLVYMMVKCQKNYKCILKQFKALSSVLQGSIKDAKINGKWGLNIGTSGKQFLVYIV